MPVPPSFVLLQFDSGEYRLVDIGMYLSDDGPLLTRLREWGFFRQVRVDDEGVAIVWPNAFDLDPAELYALGTPVDPSTVLAAALHQ